MKKEVKIIFTNYTRVSSGRDATEYVFSYMVLTSMNIGLPDEKIIEQKKEIYVAVSGTLVAMWMHHGLNPKELYKVMFEFAKRHVVQKIKDGTLVDYEKLVLLTSNFEEPECPFKPANINDPIGYEETIDIPKTKMIDAISGNDVGNVADLIVAQRDYINAIFNKEHKEKLLFLNQERSIRDLYRDANNHDEFVNRIAAIANLAGDMNSKVLVKLVNNKNFDSGHGSITLLKEFFRVNKIPELNIIDILRNIKSLRKGFPIHGDNIENFIKACDYFEIDYPISDFSQAWRTVLESYYHSLEDLFNALKEFYKKDI